MKIRNGFVSNSSSSSFVISKHELTDLQIVLISNHSEMGKMFEMDYPEDSWEMEETGDKIELYTNMDNFNMEEFLIKIGVPPEAIINGSRGWY